MTIRSPKLYWNVLKETFSKFSENDLSTHAAALAYYTIFSLPPMLLIILLTASQFYERATVETTLFNQIGGLVGAEGALQLAQTMKKLNVFDGQWWAVVVSVGAMIFTSTTVFVTLQNTLNKIFEVKPKPEGSGIFKMIKDRVLSFAMLIGVAFILLVSLVIDALINVFNGYIENWLGVLSTPLTILFSIIVPLIVTTIMFVGIFKVLPDVDLKWRDTLFGALATAILFTAGKYGISFYIGQSDVAGLYDAAGSVLVIMVWVFYATLIIAFGAQLTFTYLNLTGVERQSSKYAVKIETIEAEVPGE